MACFPKDRTLVGAMMNYCESMRIRNPVILTGCADYLGKNARSLPAGTIVSIFVPFGSLYFRPPELISNRFWKSLEDAVANKFLQLKPNDALDVLLAFVHLERCPVKFVEKVFRAGFLDRLFHRRNLRSLDASKTKLRLFDAAMTLECPQYAGPMIPRGERPGNPVCQDARLKRIVNRFHPHLVKLAGRHYTVSKTIFLGQLPSIEFYAIDALIYPKSGPFPSQVFSLEKRHRNLSTAVLVHLPEHFCRNSPQLMGPQVTRKRHFRKLGLRVMSLDFHTLEKIVNDPLAVARYLEERLLAAEEGM
ncbi:FAST kinase domain-containing protein 3, mitochondrial-like [Diprion similis]|uniref:FAST kinase domain-containing protein 3, mitochondrial-like n=1 Tax=Diprion similis TaxID=362088 RepID=UPI001EF76F98|nr:FAST kinase domain-containing protein 3, mitochondrial-like [Diprion similis]